MDAIFAKSKSYPKPNLPMSKLKTSRKKKPTSGSEDSDSEDDNLSKKESGSKEENESGSEDNESGSEEDSESGSEGDSDSGSESNETTKHKHSVKDSKQSKKKKFESKSEGFNFDIGDDDIEDILTVKNKDGLAHIEVSESEESEEEKEEVGVQSLTIVQPNVCTSCFVEVMKVQTCQIPPPN